MKRPSKATGTAREWNQYQEFLARRAFRAINQLSKWGGRLYVLDVFRVWMGQGNWIGDHCKWRKDAKEKRKNRSK